MKRFRVVSLFLLGIVFLTFVADATAQNANWANRLFSETRYDYHGIPRNTLAKHTFSFINNTNTNIRIVSTRTSCQCTRVYAPLNKTFKPGESGEIVTEIDAIRYTGVRHATVTVVFDGPTRAEVSFDVRGLVVENVQLEPTTLKFIVDDISPVGVDAKKASTANATNSTNKTAQTDGNKPRVQRATILYPNYAETIVKTESSNPYLDVQIGQAVRTPAGLQTPLTVSLKADAPAGYFNDVVYLWSNGVNSKTPMTLSVKGVVRSKISVAPPALTFCATDDGKKIVKNIVVAGSKPFTIKNVKCQSNAVKVDFDKATNVDAGSVSAQSASKRAVYVLPVVFDPTKLRAKSTTTELKIETNDGQIVTLKAVLSTENIVRSQPIRHSGVPAAKAAQTSTGSTGRVNLR